jgi:hypothetical protein
VDWGLFLSWQARLGQGCKSRLQVHDMNDTAFLSDSPNPLRHVPPLRNQGERYRKYFLLVKTPAGNLKQTPMCVCAGESSPCSWALINAARLTRLNA